MRFILFLFLKLSLIQSNMTWNVDKNNLYYKNIDYKIKGINWFGTETACNCPHGLSIHDTEFYMDLLRKYAFNSIRIPFSYEIAMNLDKPLMKECTQADPYVQSFTTKQYLHYLFNQSARRNMTILLDLHTDHNKIQNSPLSEISLSDFQQAWINVLNEYSHYNNLIGIDIKNEPHGDITWEIWSKFILDFISFVDDANINFRGLFWIEGIEDNSPWGGSFDNLKTLLGLYPNKRIVFSPHVYGVSVRGYSSLFESSKEWDSWFGFLMNFFDNFVCIGEIGGINGGADYVWHQNILAYLKSRSIQNFYYWCLNPNSKDTGGLLGWDWTTVDKSKIDFCYNLQSNSTFISFID